MKSGSFHFTYKNSPKKVLSYNSYTGMSRPTASYFWYFNVKRGIIFKPDSAKPQPLLAEDFSLGFFLELIPIFRS